MARKLGAKAWRRFLARKPRAKISRPIVCTCMPQQRSLRHPQHTDLGKFHSFLVAKGLPSHLGMRQTDYAVGLSRERLRKARRRSLIAHYLPDVGLRAKIRLAQRASMLRRHISEIVSRSARIALKEFDLNEYDERRALRDFRFLTSEIRGKLVQFFSWNKSRTSRNRYKCTAILATCVVLRRLASPARWEDLSEEFGKFPAQLSEIFWESLERMLSVRSHLILTWRQDSMSSRASMYAAHIHEHSPLESCVGYIDCTKQKVSRPGGHNKNQRALYTGHKRTWCLKWQTVSTPDGLIIHLWGPDDGRRHDSTLYRKSGIDEILEFGLLINGVRYCIYGDAAYILRLWLQVAYPRIGATPLQQSYNTDCNAGRTSVEWSYKDARQSWTSIDFQRKMKVRESPVALLNIAAMLLWNVKVVLGHGSQSSAFMGDCPPPTWDEYVI